MNRVVRATWALREIALDLVFPWLCVGCGADEGPFCGSCFSAIPFLPTSSCRRCGLPLPRAASTPPTHALAVAPDVCRECGRRPPPWRRLVAVGVYEPGARNALHRAIWALKYEDRPALAGPLGDLLAERLVRVGGTLQCVVAAPGDPVRLRERGYHPAALVARRVARRLGLPVSPRALARLRPLPPQARLSRTARRRNLEGVVAVRLPSAVAGRRVLLVDDVATTTETARACTRALLRAGARSVDVAAVGRTLAGPN